MTTKAPRSRNAQGTVDPTRNVIDLVEKETKRGDDLRVMSDRLLAAEVSRINGELGCIKEVAKLRASHDRQLRKAEASRLDSIRQVDISAVSTAAGEVRTAIAALATQTSLTAETLRSTVTSTATNIANQTAATVDAIVKRIAALELSAAQGLGKQAVEDPQLKALAKAVEDLSHSQATGAGGKAVWALVAGVVVSLVVGLLIVLARSRIGG